MMSHNNITSPGSENDSLYQEFSMSTSSLIREDKKSKNVPMNQVTPSIQVSSSSEFEDAYVPMFSQRTKTSENHSYLFSPYLNMNAGLASSTERSKMTSSKRTVISTSPSDVYPSDGTFLYNTIYKKKL